MLEQDKKKEKEEKKETERKEKDRIVEKAIKNMSQDEYSIYSEKVKGSYYYRNVLEEQVLSGKVTEEDAVRDAIKIVYYDKLVGNGAARER